MTCLFSGLDELNREKPILDGVHVNVAQGAAAATNIAVATIKTSDKLLFVKRLSLDTYLTTVTLTDITSSVTITSAGQVQVTAIDTTGDALEIWWYKRS